jgi:hypothetical protein
MRPTWIPIRKIRNRVTLDRRGGFKRFGGGLGSAKQAR